MKKIKGRKSLLIKTESIPGQLPQEEGYKISTGELIDRLSIVNVKMWHMDEGIAKAIKAGDKLKAGELAGFVRELNADRADLREEINRRVDGVGKGTNKIEYATGRGVGLKKC